MLTVLCVPTMRTYLRHREQHQMLVSVNSKCYNPALQRGVSVIQPILDNINEDDIIIETPVSIMSKTFSKTSNVSLQNINTFQ